MNSQSKTFYKDFLSAERKFRNSAYYISAKEQADTAKAVMFRDNLKVIFERYRISENSAEVTRRVELAEAVNKDDFQRAIRYLSKFIDIDSVSSNINNELYNYIELNGLEEFFRDEVLPTLLSSPNSVLALIPKIYNGDVKTEPIIVDIEDISYIDGEVLIFEYDTGLYIYTSSTEVFAFGSDGIYNDSVIKFSVPTKLWFEFGGISKRVKNKNLPRYLNTIYESFFDGAIRKSVMACRIASDKELTRMRSAHPLVAMKRLPCTECNSAGCDTCNNTGYVEPAPSMGAVFYFTEADVLEGNNTNQIDNIIKYLQPPLEAVAVQREEYILHSNECKEALNFIYVNEAQSGVAKMIDREDKRISSTTILRVVYRMMEEMLTSIGLLQNTITEPVKFDLPLDITENNYDTLAKISSMRSTGTSYNLIVKEYETYYRNYYGDNPVMLLLNLWALENVPYYTYPKDELPADNDIVGLNKTFNYINDKYGTKILEWSFNKLNKTILELWQQEK